MPGHDVQTALGAVGRRREGVDGRYLEGQLDTADACEVDGEPQEVGAVWQGRKRPRERQGEVEVVGWLLFVGELHDHVLEGEEHPRVDLEREVQVERSPATLFRMEVDLPDLAEGVRLDEVTLVVDVEPVVDGVVLEIGDVAGDIDGSHSAYETMGCSVARGAPAARRSRSSLPVRNRRAAPPVICRPVGGAPGDPDDLIPVLLEGARAVRAALDGIDPADRRRPGTRPGQYALDVVADDAVRAVLHREGLAVLSEESGRSGPESGLLVVVDPVDGSTNASLGIPWYSTSLCVLDEAGALAGLVVHQVSGVGYHAVRDHGALRDASSVTPAQTNELSHAVVGISGFPRAYPGWSQFRALGAASLDMCAVAEGVLDAYTVAGRSALFVWDYLAAMLVCAEAGAVVAERDGLDLVVRDGSPRRPVVAATAPLLAQLSAAEL